MEKIIHSPDNLELVAKELLDFAGDRRIFLFYGDIGAGKTTFIQAICGVLGVEDKVTSPTFSLINVYPYQGFNGDSRQVFHMDLYRLNDLEEALNIGLEDYLYGSDYCFIEWPELIEPILPEEVVRIRISIESDSSRKILFLLS